MKQKHHSRINSPLKNVYDGLPRPSFLDDFDGLGRPSYILQRAVNITRP